MQSIQFHKEGISEYMFFQIEAEEKWNYENMLFRYHKVPYFLSYEIRCKNDSYFLYYKIKDKNTLKNISTLFPFTEEVVTKMLLSFINAIMNTRDYLLDLNKILWDMDCVFFDIHTGELTFCYCPYVEEPNDMYKFFTELINYVGKKNQKIMLKLMDFYNCITEPDWEEKDLINLKNRLLEKTKDINLGKEEPEEKEKLHEFIKQQPEDENHVIDKSIKEKKGFFDFLKKKRKEKTKPDNIIEKYFEEEEIAIKPEEKKNILVVEDYPSVPCLVPVNKMHATIKIEDKSIVVGSLKSSCDYIIESKWVSRIHAKLRGVGMKLYLIDMNSTNGTFVNGKRINSGEEILLQVGDRVRFFREEYVVSQGV